MVDNKPQKTLEDYRNIIKLLKLKVMKLQKKNQELEQKLYEPFEDSYISGVEDIQTQATKKNRPDPSTQTEGLLMQDLYRGCRKLGITTEGLYRAADKEGSKNIPLEEFKFFLKNCRLELTAGQTNRLASMADEGCNGHVTWQNWINALEMYECLQEKTSSGSDRSFAQQSVFKLANIFIKKKISPEEGFDQMAKGHSTVTNERLKSYCMNEDSSMADKQCSSAFNHLDFSKKGRIIKEFFVTELRKVMRILADEQGLTISQFCPPQGQALQRPNQPIQQQQQSPRYQDEPQQQQQQLLQPQQNMRSSMKKNSRILNNDSALNQSQVVYDYQVSQVDSKVVVDALQKQGVDIGKLFQELLDDLTNPLAGIRIKDVFNAFNSVAPRTPKSLQFQFFNCIDKGGNGGADFNECLEFYCRYMEIDRKESWPVELVFGMKNQHLKATMTRVDEYLDTFQIDERTEINPKTFQYQAKKMFNITDPKSKVKQLIANEVQGQNLLAHQLAHASINKKGKKLKKKKAKMEIKLDEFGKWLQAVREQQGKQYELEEDDFFVQKKLEGDTSAKEIETPWKTILNDEIACLIKCIEILADLKKKKQERWTDPEFGPNDTDKVGASALYFADNEISPGAPQPEDVQWLRSDDLLQLLCDTGETFKTGEIDKEGNPVEEDYEDKEVCFMEGGASSNDVKQSQYLGNCWFVSALSIIAQDDNLLNGYFDADENTVKDIDNKEADGMAKGVYPPMFHFLEQYGIYVCKFFKNSGWRYVIVDDRIPCKEGGEVIYGQCKQKNELWVPIIEKAYAKLHNCYQALIAGDIAQGLADMTGKIADKTKLEFERIEKGIEIEQNKKDSIKNEADALWEKLKEAKNNGTMMGCSAEGETEGFIEIDGESSGVMSGHAYSVLDVIELPYLNSIKEGKKGRGFHRLLRIRNPWGHGEWKFKWSDTGSEHQDNTFKYKDSLKKYYEQERELARKWNREHPDEDQKDLAEIEDIELGVDDGTFLMCFKDWRELYANLFMCIDFPNDWSGRRITGSWTPELSAGPPKKGKMEDYAQKNPQYIIKLNRQRGRKGIKDKDKTQIYINQTQRDGRLFWGEKYPFDRVTTFMLLCVFKLDQGEKELSKFDKSKMGKGGSSKSLILRREIDSDFMDLENGTYAVIPCTKTGGYTGQFALNIYFDCDPQDIQFSGAYGREGEAKTIAEEEEKVGAISEEKRNIFQDLARKELEMLKDKEAKHAQKIKK